MFNFVQYNFRYRVLCTSRWIATYDLIWDDYEGQTGIFVAEENNRNNQTDLTDTLITT